MYFEWTKMPDVADVGGAHFPVAIVGGGPIGLGMAQALACRGIRSVILEARDQVSDGSRAVAFTRRTLQIFDTMGIGADVLARATTWDLNTVHYGTRQVYQMRLPQPAHEKHRMTNLQQCWVEQILLDHLRAGKMAEIRWRREVVGLRQEGALNRLTVRRPDGSEYVLSADYVIAADGARGPTRKFVGLAYEGARFEQRFIITDYHLKTDRPAGRSVWFSPPYAPGTTILQHREPYDIWRLDYQLLPEDDAEAEMQPERIKARVEAHLKMIGETAPYELIWSSIYRANAISLPAYRKGRVLFIGDAAHQVPIFGGRGINNGYLDVINLAWKLAYVIDGRADDSLLDSYSDERHASIQQTMEDLTKITMYMTTPSGAVELMRDAVLSLSLSEKFVHTLFDPFRIAPYVSNPVNLDQEQLAEDAAFAGGPPAGRVVPDMAVTVGPQGQASRLLDELGGELACIAFCPDDSYVGAIDDLFRKLAARQVPIRRIVIGAHRAPAVACAELSLQSDAAAALFAATADAVYVIRPDHHVLARWTRSAAATVDVAVKHLLKAAPTGDAAMAPPAPAADNVPAVERDFQALCAALDGIADDQRLLFLSKLALLLSNEIADKEKLRALFDRAMLNPTPV